MIPIDLRLFEIGLPLLLLFGASILFLWSKVEQPLKTAHFDANSNEAFTNLKEALHRKGIVTAEENKAAGWLKIKGYLKIVDVILYRCWSKELIFRLSADGSGTRVTITGKPNPFRMTASPRNPNYISKEGLESILEEAFRDPKMKGAF